MNDLLKTQFRVEKVNFSRPDSDVKELGIRVERLDGRSIIIDKDMNIVINCSYNDYGECLAKTNLIEL